MAKLSVEQGLMRVKSMEKKGQVQDARRLLAELIAAYPNNQRLRQAASAPVAPSSGTMPPQAVLHDLGKLFAAGRLEQVAQSAQALLRQFPNADVLWNMLGASLAQMGRPDQAVEAFRRSCEINPASPDGQSNLGNALKATGDMEGALTAYALALKLNPGFAKALYNRANALRDLGRLDEAEADYRRVIAAEPNWPDALNNLGALLLAKYQDEAAEAMFRKAVAHQPKFVDAQINLGVSLQRRGAHDEAVSCFEAALAVDPSQPKALNNLAISLKALQRKRDALAALEKAIAADPRYSEARQNLGQLLSELGRFDEAVDYFRSHLEQEPDDPKILKYLASALHGLGRTDEMIEALERAIALKPDYLAAHAELATVKEISLDDPAFEMLLAAFFDPSHQDEMRLSLTTGLIKTLEKARDHARAFRVIREANAIKRRIVEYDPEKDREVFRSLRETADQFAQNALGAHEVEAGITPIFVLGMPRSGTTLVEQIISSHPEVSGAGELSFVKAFGSEMAFGRSGITKDALLAFRKTYLHELADFSHGKPFVTDKMPHNFLYIGLIAAAFPEARIVHLNRNAAAVCWSNYKHIFAGKGLGYCYDLKDVVEYHGHYRELMAFWAERLGDRIHQLDYERLTREQEDETRKLLSYLGLSWDDACLSPQENKRGVRTASIDQVRQKVYTGSSEAWRAYETYLDGAFDQLPE